MNFFDDGSAAHLSLVFEYTQFALSFTNTYEAVLCNDKTNVLLKLQDVVGLQQSLEHLSGFLDHYHF